MGFRALKEPDFLQQFCLGSLRARCHHGVSRTRTSFHLRNLALKMQTETVRLQDSNDLAHPGRDGLLAAPNLWRPSPFFSGFFAVVF